MPWIGCWDGRGKGQKPDLAVEWTSVHSPRSFNRDPEEAAVESLDFTKKLAGSFRRRARGERLSSTTRPSGGIDRRYRVSDTRRSFGQAFLQRRGGSEPELFPGSGRVETAARLPVRLVRIKPQVPAELAEAADRLRQIANRDLLARADVDRRGFLVVCVAMTMARAASRTKRNSREALPVPKTSINSRPGAAPRRPSESAPG